MSENLFASAIVSLFLGMVLGVFTPPEAKAEMLDNIDVGNPESEAAHNLEARGSALADTVSDEALGESGRRLKARTNVSENLDGEDWMGGWMAFNLATEPDAITYITLKLWGPDVTDGSFSLMLDRENEEAPYRWIDRGSPLFRSLWTKKFRGPKRDQWVYRTYALPCEEVTRGKEQVRLRLQQTKDVDTSAIYSIYSHTNPFFEPPADEPQGERFEWGKTHGDAADILADIDEEELIERAKKRIKKKMENGGKDLIDLRKLRDEDVDSVKNNLRELVEIYNTEWSGYYRDERIIHRVKQVLDEMAKQYAKKGSLGMRWAGAGRAYARPYTKLHKGFEDAGVLDEKIELGVGEKKMTRRKAYAQMFKGEFDAFHMKRRSYTNQTYYGNIGLYFLNRALLQLAPDQALSEAHARWFAYSTFGMVPFGADQNEWDEAVTEAGYPRLVVTEKGLTRERGFVNLYGEMTSQFAEVAGDIGDPLLKDRAAEMMEARAHMRFPRTGDDGYRSLGRIGVLGWRKHAYYPSGEQYVHRGRKHQEVVNLKDPVSVRMSELAIEHQGKKSKYMPDASINGVKYYRVLKEALPTDYRLPFEEENDEYAWADEGNGIFMIHHGDEFIWGSFYNPPAHNGYHTRGRIRHMTPLDDRVVDMEQVAKAPDTGQFHELDTSMDEGHENVTADRRLSIPPPPPGVDWSMVDWGPPPREIRMGKAWFYQVNYGDYLIGMNTTKKDAFNASLYELDVPDKYRDKTALDLVTGREVDLSEPVIVGPSSTMVLYMGEE